MQAARIEDGDGKGHDSIDGHEDEVEHGGVKAEGHEDEGDIELHDRRRALHGVRPVEPLEMRWASMDAGAVVLAHPRRHVRTRSQPPCSHACVACSPTEAAVLEGSSFAFAVGKE